MSVAPDELGGRSVPQSAGVSKSLWVKCETLRDQHSGVCHTTAMANHPPETHQLAVQQIELRWPPFANASPTVVNQFLLQEAPPSTEGVRQGTYLVLGHFALPIVFNEKDFQAATSSGVVDIAHAGTYYLTVDRLRELHGAISSHLESIDGSATEPK